MNLSIVIPFYKLTFFESTLKSLSEQTDKRFKVYIGDDASPEDPSALLGKYVGKFNFTYHRFDTNLGGTSLTQQWERCIDLSENEEWIMILGDDDVLDINFVEAFYENIAEVVSHKILVIRYATIKIDESGNFISNLYCHPKIENSVDFIFRKTRSSLSEYIFFKDKLIRVGFKNFPLGWHSDQLAILEVSDFKDIFTINHALVFIRHSFLSISGARSNLKIKRIATVKYFYYLANSKRKKFNIEQSHLLFKNLNKTYLSDKRNVFLFIKISNFYLSNFLVGQFYIFISSIFFKIRKSFN
ncbi:glycosyltransferase family 2 protein [Flavobacterium branchiicola]|uniref:Glycosyltransferase family 2 protein n=1 Tax=Flavobacterium branchiicola TaxID=1114875 RepID=A0ABV9PFF8_9FLAO|nr:glycosyltransferase family 2 protein [Flavobacterium branchiicola]MBS7255480.1 glycosyltransferase family 2 protein [Flavobacterium branchiicola]